MSYQQKGEKWVISAAKPLKKGEIQYHAEVRLKGLSKTLTAIFDRKSDAKAWIQKTEADIRCGRHHTLVEAIDRWRKEYSISIVKRGYLQW